MTGAYLRIKRNDKWENIEIEYLTPEERESIFLNKKTTKESIYRWLEFACQQLYSIALYVDKKENL